MVVDRGPAVGPLLVRSDWVDEADVVGAKLSEPGVETRTLLTVPAELDDPALLAVVWLVLEVETLELDVDEVVLVVDIEDADT